MSDDDFPLVWLQAALLSPCSFVLLFDAWRDALWGLTMSLYTLGLAVK